MNISEINASELDELSQNRSCEDIEKLYSLLEESIRHNLSARLMDTDEGHPLDVWIYVEFGACGLSGLEMPTIESIYQDSSEGIIYVKYTEADDYVELDDLHIEDRIQIVKEL